MSRWSYILKALLVGFLTVLLLIPLLMTRGAIEERTRYREQAVDNVTRSYAGPQILGGPVVTVRYQDEIITEAKNDEGEIERYTEIKDGLFYVYAKKTAVNAELKPMQRKLGIFEVQTYEAATDIKSEFSFTLPQPTTKYTTRRYEPLILSMNIQDPRGLAGSPSVRVNNEAKLLQPSSGPGGRGNGVHTRLQTPVVGESVQLNVKFDLALGGTQQLAVVPMANENEINLKSNWPHPTFLGDFLPRTRDVSSKGFNANWSLTSLATQAQQNYAKVESLESLEQVSVRLVNPVDIYTQADRASKYGFLFVILTFCGFALFELMKRIPIHPVQYGLVGLALAIFFLLLLSLSEHMNFVTAYAIASASCIGLLWVYLSAVLKSWLNGSVFAGLFTLLYSALYGLLISEDNALIMGSLLLFVILAGVMLLTRNVDWYSLGQDSKPPRLP
jgi:inner membrane protein